MKLYLGCRAMRIPIRISHRATSTQNIMAVMDEDMTSPRRHFALSAVLIDRNQFSISYQRSSIQQKKWLDIDEKHQLQQQQQQQYQQNKQNGFKSSSCRSIRLVCNRSDQIWWVGRTCRRVKIRRKCGVTFQ